MTPLQSLTLVLVALLGPGGLVVAVVSSRRTRQVTAQVAESVVVAGERLSDAVTRLDSVKSEPVIKDRL